MDKTKARRLRWLHLKTEKKMSLRAIGAQEGVSGEYVRQIIGNTGHMTGRVRPVKAHLLKVHAFIKAYTKDNSRPPTLGEIADTFPNLEGSAPTSLSVVANWLGKLEEMGKLQITRGVSRGLKAL